MVKHTDLFSITYTIGKKWTNCLTYSPCPYALAWKGCHPKHIITEPFNNAEKIDVSKICLDVLLGGNHGREGGGTITSNLNSYVPHLNFVRQSITLKPYMPPGHNLQSLPQGCGGCVNPECIVIYSMDYFVKNEYLTIWIRCVSWKKGS